MRNDGYILGIDPDSDKSGFALLNCATRSIEFIEVLSFTDAIKYLDGLAAIHGTSRVLLVIEDSDSSTNWHCGFIIYDKSLTMDQKVRKAAAIGRSAGLCHATIRHLREYAESCGYEVQMQKPLLKYWKGKDRKITHEELSSFVKGLPKRTNSEERDAALLAWVAAGFEIRIRL